MKRFKKLLSLLLCFAMVLSSIPTMSFAEDGAQVSGDTVVIAEDATDTGENTETSTEGEALGGEEPAVPAEGEATEGAEPAAPAEGEAAEGEEPAAPSEGEAVEGEDLQILAEVPVTYAGGTKGKIEFVLLRKATQAEKDAGSDIIDGHPSGFMPMTKSDFKKLEAYTPTDIPHWEGPNRGGSWITGWESAQEGINTFYLGIKCIGLDNIDGMASTMKQMAVGINYDSDYLVVEPNALYTSASALNTTELDKTMKERLQDNDYSIVNDQAGGTFSFSDTNFAQDKSASDESVKDLGDNWKQLFASTLYSSDSGSEFDGTPDQYLFAYEIGVKAIPEDGAEVFKVPAVYKGSRFSISLAGSGGYTAGSSGNDKLENVLELAAGDNLNDVFPTKYKITYDANGGNWPTTGFVVGTDNVQKIEAGTLADSAMTVLATQPTPADSNYFFDGWYDAQTGGNKFTENTSISADTTVYAQYKEGYKLTLNGNDGTFTSGKTTEEISKAKTENIAASEITTIGDPERTDGYAFDGWNTLANGTGTAYADANALATAISGTKTSLDVFAQWTPNSTNVTNNNIVTVKFDDNDNNTATSASPAEKTIVYGTALGDSAWPTDPVRDGYDFKGWDIVQNGVNGTKVEKTTVIDNTLKSGLNPGDELTLYAQWKVSQATIDAGNAATVTFTATDADVTAQPNPSSITVKKNDIIGDGNMPNKPERTGYSFAKWLMPDGTTEFNGSTQVTGDITVTADWSQDVTIKFNLNATGASWTGGTAPQDLVLKYNDVIPAAKIPAVTAPTGYDRYAWNSESDGSGTTLDETGATHATANTEYFAMYRGKVTPTNPDDPQPGETATVTFHANGGTFAGTPDTTVGEDATKRVRLVNVNDTIGTAAGLPVEPTHTDDYTFAGWFTELIGGEQVTGATKVEGNMDVYARWTYGGTADAVTINFYRNVTAGETALASIKVKKGDKLPFTTEPTVTHDITGYEFLRWNDAAGNAVAGKDDAGQAISGKENLLTWTTTTSDPDTINLYAIWKVTLYFTIGNNVAYYDGNNHEVTVTKITVTTMNGADVTSSFTEGVDYTIEYNKPKSDGSGNEVTSATADSLGKDTSNNYIPYGFQIKPVSTTNGPVIKTDLSSDELTVKPLGLTFKLKQGQTQVRKTDGPTATTVEELLFEIGGGVKPNAAGTGMESATVPDSGLTVTTKYYSWNANTGVANKTELTEAERKEYAVRAVQPTVNNKNYEFYGYVANADGTNVDELKKLDGTGSGYASFEIAKKVSLDGMNFKQKDITDTNPAADPLPLYKEDTLQNQVLNDEVKKADMPYYAEVEPGKAITVNFTNGSTLPEGTDVTITLKDGKGNDIPLKDKDGNPVNLEDLLQGTENPTTGKIDNITGIKDIILPAPTPKTDGSANGFDNKLVITIGQGATAETYEIDILQKATPGVALDPGNSPYGLIERMAEKYHGTTGAWDEQKIADAKTNFVNEDLGNDKSAYQFATNFTPTNGDASVSYSNYAWEGSDALPAEKRDNLDLDPNTQFIYSALDFALAGFEATDSRGNKADVTVTVQVDVMGDSNWDYLKDGNDTSGNPYVVKKTLVLQDDAGLAPTVDNNTVIALTTKGDGFESLLSKGLFVRPGVYDLTYSFKDAGNNNQTVTATRKLVVLWEVGDCDLNSQVAGTDVTALRKYANGKSDPYVGVPIVARDLHKYRIIDVDYNSQIAGTDVTALRKRANGKSTLNPYYYNFDVTV